MQLPSLRTFSTNSSWTWDKGCEYEQAFPDIAKSQNSHIIKNIVAVPTNDMANKRHFSYPIYPELTSAGSCNMRGLQQFPRASLVFINSIFCSRIGQIVTIEILETADIFIQEQEVTQSYNLNKYLRINRLPYIKDLNIWHFANHWVQHHSVILQHLR